MTWFCACRKGNGGGLWQKCKLFCKYCLRFGKLVCIMTPTQQNHPALAIPGLTKRKREGVQGMFPARAATGPSDRAEPGSSLKKHFPGL